MKHSNRFPVSRGPLRLAALVLSAGSMVTAAAQPNADAPATPPPSAVPGEGVLRSIGSFFSSIVPAAASATQPTSAPLPPAQGEVPESSSPATQPGTAFNVLDIDSWSRTSNIVLDPQCKNLVQPFDITDNAASLALLAGKLKVKGFLDSLQGQSQAPLRTGDVVKLAARQLNWLPMALEREIGVAMVPDADILDENKNADAKRTYAQARAVLADIVKELPQPLPYEFKVMVRTTSYGNASALPGGIVLVDRDLFKRGADLDFAYFVMAHEIAHILQRHQTRMYQARLVDGIDTLDGFGKLLGSTNAAQPAALVGYASSLKRLFVDFTEHQELQADSCAVRLLAARVKDPKVLESKLAAIERALGPITAAVPPKATTEGASHLADHLKFLGDGIFERHPNTDQRRNNLRSAHREVRGGQVSGR